MIAPNPNPRSVPAPRHTVLVVEDNPITLKMVRLALEAGGYRVLTAGAGAATQRALGAGRYYRRDRGRRGRSAGAIAPHAAGAGG